MNLQNNKIELYRKRQEEIKQKIIELRNKFNEQLNTLNVEFLKLEGRIELLEEIKKEDNND